MHFSLSFFIALRYFLSTRKQGYLSLISWFSLLGITLGVAALIIVSSVMNGFEQQLQQRILNVVPHIFVSDISADNYQQTHQLILQHKDVLAVSDYRQIEGISSYENSIAGVVINGTAPETLASVSLVPSSMIIGSIDTLSPGEFNIIIGSGLSRQLGIYVGDKLTLLLPKVTTTPAGIFPRTKRFTVSGIFEVGAQVDATEVYIHLNHLNRLLREPVVTKGLRIATSDVLKATQVANDLKTVLTNVTVKDWSYSHGGLFQAVKVEKIMVAVLLAVIIAVAVFNVVAVLTMMVINKRSAIAVLRTMGASRQTILSIFVFQGFMVGLIGTALGVLIGLPIALFLEPLMLALENIAGLSFFDANVYYIAQLPSDVRLNHVINIVSLSLLMSIVATLYPASRAAAVHPSEVLRYE